MRRLFLIAFFALAACAPQQQTYNASSQEPALEQNHFITADGAILPTRSWTVKNPKAIIIALHGFNDYSNAFATSGAFFSKHGISVYAYDQRGFGGSPETAIWAGRENLIGDLHQFTALINQRYPAIPLYLLGDSMGGAVVINAAAETELPGVKGIILAAPAVWGSDTMPLFYRGLLWTGAHTFPGYKLTGQNLKIRPSDNIEMLRALGRDPLVIKATRIDAVYGLVHLMDDAYEKVDDISTPALLLYGAHDQVIPKLPIESARERFAVPLTYVYYPDGYHMLLRDLQGTVVMRDIASWIRHPDAPLPSGFGEISPEILEKY
jgi:acylglycerol lipase